MARHDRSFVLRCAKRSNAGDGPLSIPQVVATCPSPHAEEAAKRPSRSMAASVALEAPAGKAHLLPCFETRPAGAPQHEVEFLIAENYSAATRCAVRKGSIDTGWPARATTMWPG